MDQWLLPPPSGSVVGGRLMLDDSKHFQAKGEGHDPGLIASLCLHPHLHQLPPRGNLTGVRGVESISILITLVESFVKQIPVLVLGFITHAFQIQQRQVAGTTSAIVNPRTSRSRLTAWIVELGCRRPVEGNGAREQRATRRLRKVARHMSRRVAPNEPGEPRSRPKVASRMPWDPRSGPISSTFGPNRQKLAESTCFRVGPNLGQI